MRLRTRRNLMSALCSEPLAIDSRWLDRMAELLSQAASKRLVRAAIRSGKGSPQQQQPGGVVVLPLIGVVTPRGNIWTELFGGAALDALSRQFDAAVADATVKTIVLYVDSPGGSVTGVEEFAAKVFAAREQKRIIAVADGLCASAAFWIASAAGEFVAAPSSVVGSIGAIVGHFDDSKWEEKHGFETTWFTSSKFKGEGHKPLTDGSRANYQAIVDGFHASFVAAVARNRSTTVANVEAEYGQGSIVTARVALNRGMVDRIATLQEVLSGLGVGQPASSDSPTSRPAFSLEDIRMNPKLFGLLVRAGMIEMSATEAVATAALAKACASLGVADSADEPAKIAALESYCATLRPAASPAAAATAQMPVASHQAHHTATNAAMADREASIRAAVAIAAIPEADKFATFTELVNAKGADGKPITPEAAMERLREKIAGANQPAGVATRITPGPASRDKFMDAASHAIISRMFGGSVPKTLWDHRTRTHVEYKPQPGAAAYHLQRLPRLAEECLIADGWNPATVRSLAPLEQAKLAMGVSPHALGIPLASSDGPAYNTTGTFQNLMLDASNKTLRAGYDGTATTFQAWARQGPSVADFKDVHRVVFGDLTDPKAVPENGELSEMTVGDAKEKYSLVVWGGRFSLSFQAVVNDDLNAFARLPQMLGASFRRKQNRIVYGVLKDNPTMADTGALFNSTAITTAGGHNNSPPGPALRASPRSIR